VRFRAVFFDAGETLVHPVPSFPEAFVRIVTDAGYRCEAEDVVAASSVVMERFSEAAATDERWTTSPDRSRRFWTEIYERMLVDLGLPSRDGLRDALYRAFTDLANYGVFDDVVPALEALGETAAILGVVSNYEPWLEDLLAEAGVADALPIRVISGIEGIEKPDPRIYELALERAGVTAAEAAYVGDDPEFDVDPPTALGMFAVLVDRRDRHADHVGPRVEDLRDLPALLASA
jgi:putative hydrolase of the HAD superfamily